MNLKALAKIFLVFLVLTISVGVISAADSNITPLEASSNYLDKEVLADYDWDDDDDDRDDNYGYYKKPATKVSKSKIKTEVDADQVIVKYKKNNYFKIKVEDRYDDNMPIGKVKLKVKVGKKIFKVKTNSWGVAKINTKGLKVGTHKVLITSADKKYDISKKSKIIVSKQYSTTMKGTSSKVLKNGAKISLRVKNDDDDKEYKLVLKKKSKHTKITKAVFYFKNKYTGNVIVKTDRAEFDDGHWEMPEEDCSYAYTLMKVKVYYTSTK